MNRRTDSRAATRRKDPMLLLIAGMLFGCAAGVIGYVAKVLREGTLDSRPKHAPPTDPLLVHAANEPVWFYGIVAVLGVLALLLVVVAWRMLRAGLGGR